MIIKYKKIYFIGPQHSGKGLARLIFDGHECVSNLLFQGSTFSIFKKIFFEYAEKNNNKNSETNKLIIVKFKNQQTYNLTSDNIINFLQLNDKLFPQLLKASKNKIIKGPFEKEETIFDFDFEFDNFLSNIKQFLEDKGEVTLEDIQDIIYNSYFNNWKNNKNPNKSILIQSATTNIANVEKMFEQTINTYLLFILRDTIEVLFSNAKSIMKSKFPKLYQSKEVYESWYFKKFFLSRPLLIKIDNYKKMINILQSNFPDRIFVTNFEDLIKSDLNTINKIANKLKIQSFKNSIFLSINSCKLEDQSFLNETKDNYKVFLSEKLINKVKKFIELH